MSNDEFQKLNQFILGELDKVSKEDSPIFKTTTTRLAGEMNYQIPLIKGHKAFYKDFCSAYKENWPEYDIKAKYMNENSDTQFDLWFIKLN